MKLWLKLATSLLILSGCAQTKIPFDETDNTKVGYIVGTIGEYDPLKIAGSYWITFCERGTTREFNAFFVPRGLFDDRKIVILQDERFTGSAFALKVPAGTYDICDTTVARGTAYVTAKARFIQPITVEPGKANYVGRFLAIPTARDGMLGSKHLNSFQWQVSNRQRDDLMELTKINPEAAALPVVSTVPPATSLIAPFFIREAP
ncbi:hypothetical protein ACFSM5_20580 [Lacibacterium aquatile]|uniref:DUF2846 domain-containing protein n=1 Tax=Lacibacterium aquatile TaxID=1168082 RepID=A0ABW5DWN4_9PROT